MSPGLGLGFRVRVCAEVILGVNLCGSHHQSPVTLKIGSAQVATTLVAIKVLLSKTVLTGIPSPERLVKGDRSVGYRRSRFKMVL